MLLIRHLILADMNPSFVLYNWSAHKTKGVLNFQSTSCILTGTVHGTNLLLFLLLPFMCTVILHYWVTCIVPTG